jgi:hypothetical protein
MLFAHLKRILQLGRLRLRGSSGARDEFLLVRPPKIRRRWQGSFPPARLTPRWPEGDTDNRTSSYGAFLGNSSAPTLKLRFDDIFNEISAKEPFGNRVVVTLSKP